MEGEEGEGEKGEKNYDGEIGCRMEAAKSSRSRVSVVSGRTICTLTKDEMGIPYH